MKTISAAQTREKWNAGEQLSIIDVREKEEVGAGMIPGAKHIRLSEIPDRLHEIERDKAHIIVCRSGSRSANATAYLEKQGYEVSNMTGGMLDWKEEVTN